ncbi:DUF47 family protein [Candidatus Woesearchaeota archaeon]|nr:DUF47 family protein [Candidatus Woesearchaeota archaeon]
MRKIISFILSKEKKFLEMLSSQSEIALEASKMLKDFVDEYPGLQRSERKSRAHSIKKTGLRADELKRSIALQLESSYAVPANKEHIARIAALLGEISDLAGRTALMLVILSIERIDGYAAKMAGMAHSIIEETSKGVKSLGKPKNIKEHCERIYGLGAEAGEIYNEALSELFHFYKNSIDIIKYREIYRLLKAAVDKCSETAEILELIAARHF